MENIIEMLKTDEFILAMAIILVILIIAFITIIIRFSILNKRYKNFMKKLGNGNNIEEDLKNYINKVNEVKEQNTEIITKVDTIKQDLTKCIQKIGMYRYNAFKDTGSDLSFTLALLDENNDGVVLNGIYSREMSNIYAKPVKNGQSSYTITEEESKAIKKAIDTGKIIK